jgi:hypothetical protein
MILSFPDLEMRGRFVDLVRRERPDIVNHLEEALNRPDLLAPGLDADQRQWISDHVADYGRAFTDIKFETFEP